MFDENGDLVWREEDERDRNSKIVTVIINGGNRAE